MKTKIVLLSVFMFLALSCTSNSIVGKWKVSGRYDKFDERWNPVHEDIYLELLDGGRFKASKAAQFSGGSYTLDHTVTPYRIGFNDENVGPVNGIYKLEGNKLILMFNPYDRTQFPANFETGPDGDVELAEFERQHQ